MIRVTTQGLRQIDARVGGRDARAPILKRLRGSLLPYKVKLSNVRCKDRVFPILGDPEDLTYLRRHHAGG
jgi:hypothetical protein